MLAFGGASEEIPGLLGLGVTRAHPEHLRLIDDSLSEGTGEVQQNSTRGPNRIVADALDDEHRELGSEESRDLVRVLHHLVVVGYEARPPQLVERQEQLAIGHIGKVRVDAAERDELHVEDEAIKAVEDRLGEVLVERE